MRLHEFIGILTVLYLLWVIWLFPLLTGCKAHGCKHNSRGCARGMVTLNNKGVCDHLEAGE